MKHEFIPYEEALELKELGFDEECLMEYHNKEIRRYSCSDPSNNSELGDLYGGKVIGAPLHQQAFRWFREEHNLTSHIHWTVGGKWDYTIEKSIPRDLLDMSPIRYRVDIETYEEAELACLRKLIEIVK